MIIFFRQNNKVTPVKTFPEVPEIKFHFYFSLIRYGLCCLFLGYFHFCLLQRFKIWKFNLQSIQKKQDYDIYTHVHHYTYNNITTNAIVRQYIRTVNADLRFTYYYYIQGSHDSASVFYILFSIVMPLPIL